MHLTGKDAVNQEGQGNYTPQPIFLFHNYQGGDTFQQDFQVTSSFAGRLNFLAGATYMYDRPHIDIALLGSAYQFAQAATDTFPDSNNDVTTKSIATYLEGYYRLPHHIKITLGGRYTANRQALQGMDSPGFQLFGFPATFMESKSFDDFTPRLVLAWDNGVTNVYYSYTQGFKAGGFATPAEGPGNPVAPEKITSQELGFKNLAMDGRLRTDLDVFYYENRDMQSQFISPGDESATTKNAGSVKGYGPEFEFTWQATDNLTIGGAADYLKAWYASYTNAAQVCFDPTGTMNVTAPGATLYECSGNLSGTVVPHAPRVQASLDANYNFHIGSWSASIAGVTQYRSRFYFWPGAGGPLGADQQKGYDLTNLSAYVTPPSGRLRWGVYVDNVFDTKYAMLRTTVAPYGINYNPAKPISYGVRVEYLFE